VGRGLQMVASLLGGGSRKLIVRLVAREGDSAQRNATTLNPRSAITSIVSFLTIIAHPGSAGAACDFFNAGTTVGFFCRRR
jgi:hypothetical protein